MTRRTCFGFLIGLCIVGPALAQLPKSETLSDPDKPLFQAELLKTEKLLEDAADPDTLTYVMARTWASAKQWPETIAWLRKIANAKTGLDPTRDSVFAELRGTPEFESILQAVRDSTPPVSRSRRAFDLREGDLAPESVAYDPQTRSFFFGSMRKGKVIRCSPSGVCRDFITGLGTILGLRVHERRLWLLNNTDNQSELIDCDLASGQIAVRFPLGPGHLLNDLTITPGGDIYLTDTRGMAVWRLARGSDKLSQLPHRLQAANGIAASADGNLLYVSAFPEGIVVLDLRSDTISALSRPRALCLANVDGLYFYRGSLIAVQNGIMSPRVIRIQLNATGNGVTKFEILERRNTHFDGVTTGVVAGDDFFYMANIQDEKTAAFKPITVLRTTLKRGMR